MAFRKWDFENREYKESVRSEHTWECPLCGEIFTGDHIPDECPVCLAPGGSFIWVIPESQAPEPGKRVLAVTPERKNKSGAHL
jgi:hypothetical protein